MRALPNSWRLLALLAVATFGAGCALTSKADVVNVRYFSPERVRPRLTSADTDASHGLEMQLGRVSSGANLRERIAYRGSAYELGYYDDARWTERPETFVRRELGRKLFEEHRFRRVFGGSAPRLDVEVISFDDLRLSTGRAARVQLEVVLSDDDGVIYQETLTVDRPVTVPKARIEDVVGAMSGALDNAAEQIAAKVSAALALRLARRRSPPGP